MEDKCKDKKFNFKKVQKHKGENLAPFNFAFMKSDHLRDRFYIGGPRRRLQLRNISLHVAAMVDLMVSRIGLN